MYTTDFYFFNRASSVERKKSWPFASPDVLTEQLIVVLPSDNAIMLSSNAAHIQLACAPDKADHLLRKGSPKLGQ
ncbi:hypothetical protein [Pedobacter suwonensis]|uniref:hypothetical protein n=1 Tax=Pedobacter suwonensis TaxID=332999 RepID=UPI000B80C182|nr:hypothetical protein [Pedobacter suwonensis]